MLARNASLLTIVLLLVQCPALLVGQDTPIVGQDTPTVERWQKQLRHPAPSYRAQAAYELSRLGPAAISTTDELYDLLDDADANVRLYSLHALGKLVGKPSETATQILPRLNDENEHVRYTAEWAMARIAALPMEQISDKKLLAVFRQAVVDVQNREHHVRHRQVVEEAIAQLVTRFPEEIVPQQSSAERIALEERAAQLNELQRSFEFGDTLAQLRMIDQLSLFHEQHLSQAVQATRVSILKHALLSSQPLAVDFALRRWGRAGSEAMSSLFDSLPENVVLPGWTSQLIDSVEPRNGQDVDKLLSIALQTENPGYLRVTAIEALRRIGDGMTSPSLVSSLKTMICNPEEDDSLRSEAMDSLSRLDKNEDTIRVLLSRLTNPQEFWFVRIAAAKALGQAAPDSMGAVDALLEMANGNTIEEYQLASIVESLAGFRGSARRAGQVWAKALRSEDEFTRLAGAEAVCIVGADLGDSREIQGLLIALLLDAEESSTVQAAAARGLAALGVQAVSAFSDQLTQANDRSNLRAFSALATLGPEAAPALTKCIEVIDSQEATLAAKNVAALVVGQMGRSGKPAATSLQALVDGDIPTCMRASAIIALAQIGEKPVVQADLYSADDPVMRVAVTFAQYLVGQGDRLGHLVELLDSQEPTYAADALTDVGIGATQPLLKLLRDSQRSVTHRLRALEVLLTLPQDDYRPLLALVADQDIGQECEECIADAFLGRDQRILGDVVDALRETRSPTDIERLEHIAHVLTLGVGAGGEGDWLEVDSALVRTLQRDVHSQISEWDSVRFELAQPDASSMPWQLPEFPTAAKSMAEPDSSTASEAAQEFYAASEPSGDNAEGGSPLRREGRGADRTGPTREFPWMVTAESNSGSSPQAPVQRLTPQVDSTQSQGKRVRVFYGTNRAATKTLRSLPRISSEASQKLLAIIAAIVTIAVCLFGFFRQKLAVHAVFAIGGLVVVTWFGLKGHVQPAHAPSAQTASQAAIQESSLEYGGQLSSQLALGVCEVSIPPDHVTGELESPSVFRLEFKSDAAKHVVLQSTTELEATHFFQQLDGELQRKGKNLLVFVHGYNVSFDDAARRTAQMANDLEFHGAPVFFSWPSQANWYQYQQDKKNIELSVGQIKSFLLSLAQKSGAESIDLIAHSMGSVGLTNALAEMDSTVEKPLFNHVVLAAPDIDADVFRDRIAPRINDKARRTTLYASSTDLALVASRYFNSGRRAGDSSEPILLYPGVDVIDATTVDSSLLGHTYYGGSTSVLNDLAELFRDLPAPQRTYLKTAAVEGQPYWVFDGTYTARQLETTNPQAPTLR